MACIEHTQVGHHGGYGSKRHNGKCMPYHRWAFEQHYGYLPDVVMHSCDNPRCINPAHLLPGTQADNLRDMANKRRGRNATRTFSLRFIQEVIESPLSRRKAAAYYGIGSSTVNTMRTGGFHGPSRE